MEYLLGIDIGTSGCKSILIDNSGNTAGAVVKEYRLYTPRAGWSEQEPEDWWKAVIEGILELLKKTGISGESIKGIGLSGQMHGLVALDKQDRVIRPAILWNDQRTSKQCDWITKKAGGLNGLLELTNNQMLPVIQAVNLSGLKKKNLKIMKGWLIFLIPRIIFGCSLQERGLRRFRMHREPGCLMLKAEHGRKNC